MISLLLSCSNSYPTWGLIWVSITTVWIVTQTNQKSDQKKNMTTNSKVISYMQKNYNINKKVQSPKHKTKDYMNMLFTTIDNNSTQSRTEIS